MAQTEVAVVVDMEVEKCELNKTDADYEKSVEEERMEKAQEPGPLSLGPKTFGSALQMLDYFNNFLNVWHTDLDVNQYEHLVLLDLLKKGDHTKIGDGIRAFQVRFYPRMNRKCYFLVKDDEVVDDFNFVKCVDQILPLPEDVKAKFDGNRAAAGGRGRWNGHRGRGRGRRQ